MKSAGQVTPNYVDPVRRDTVSIGEVGDNVTIRLEVRVDFLVLTLRTILNSDGDLPLPTYDRPTTQGRGSSTATSTGILMREWPL